MAMIVKVMLGVSRCGEAGEVRKCAARRVAVVSGVTCLVKVRWGRIGVVGRDRQV